MLLHPPTDKWQKLTTAMAIASHETLAKGHLSEVRLPAIVGSKERSYQAGLALCRQLGASYGAYYSSMHDVASILSARLRRGGAAAQAEKVELAGMMWDIRAKVASTVNLVQVGGTATCANEIKTHHGRYRITTAPYPAYSRFQRAVNSAACVPRDVKAAFPHHCKSKVGDAFSSVGRPLFAHGSETKIRLMRYTRDPAELSVDIERTIRLIRDDVSAIITAYDNEARGELAHRAAGPTAVMAVEPLQVNLDRYRPARGSYWDMLGEMEPDEAADLVDAVLKMDNADAAEIETAMYEDAEELKAKVWEAEGVAERVRAAAQDAVV
jgi:hypothetical protein